MDSGIVRTSSISSRNRDRAAARREVQKELNLAHMSGVMKSVRCTAREQGSGKSRVVLDEHTPFLPSNSSKPVLRIETEFYGVYPEYYKLGPSIMEKKLSRVSDSVRGEDTDRRQNADRRRHSQRNRTSQTKVTNFPKAVEERIEETPAPRRQNPTLQAEARRQSQSGKTLHRRDVDLFNAIKEQTKDIPVLKRLKPTLQLRADFASVSECLPMDAQIPKNKDTRSSHESKGDTDRHQATQSRRHSQRMKQSQTKEINLCPAVEEPPKRPAKKGDIDGNQTAHRRSYSERIKKTQPRDTTFSPIVEKPSGSLASKGDTDRHQIAHPRSYSQRTKKSPLKDTNSSPAVKEQSKESPAPTRQTPTLQIRRDSASAKFPTQRDCRQTNPNASQKEQHHVSAPIVKADVDQCQIMEIISLYEDHMTEEKKEEDLPPPIPPKSERRGKEQSRRIASGYSGTPAPIIPATDKQAHTISAPKRHKPTLRIRTGLDNACHLDYSAPETWASQQLLDYLQTNPLALENEQQGISSPVAKEPTGRSQEVKRDSSSGRSPRPGLVDIVRRGLADSEAGSPSPNPSGSACLYGDYSCIYEEYSDID